MVRADDLGREVNRLYWATEEPVTRLAAGLGVSRGTFYNYLRPLPARATCSACGGRLLFRNRSDRDAGAAHCGECDRTQATAAPGAAAGGQGAGPVTQADGPAGYTREAWLLASRQDAAAVAPPREDSEKTQLLLIAVGAAVFGLGLLIFSRRR